MAPVLPTNLNPGIERTVKWLNSIGFPTCDSGDGSTHDHDCDREDPYVVIQVDSLADNPEALVGWANNLKEVLVIAGIEVGPVGKGPVWIQANYDPTNQMGFLDVTGIHDDMLPEDINV